MAARIGETDSVPRGLASVFLLAGLAGAVDAVGLIRLKGLFVSFMSGNTTSLGVALADGDRERAGLIAAIVAMFVLGAAAGTVLATLVGRRHLPVVVAAVAAILAIPPLAPASLVYTMTFAMGVLNASMNHAGSVAVSVTYVTGTLVKIGQGLGRLACGRAAGWAWLEQGVPWFGILGGAIGAQACLRADMPRTIACLPLAALAVAIIVGALTTEGRGRAEARE